MAFSHLETRRPVSPVSLVRQAKMVSLVNRARWASTVTTGAAVKHVLLESNQTTIGQSARLVLLGLEIVEPSRACVRPATQVIVRLWLELDVNLVLLVLAAVLVSTKASATAVNLDINRTKAERGVNRVPKWKSLRTVQSVNAAILANSPTINKQHACADRAHTTDSSWERLNATELLSRLNSLQGISALPVQAA